MLQSGDDISSLWRRYKECGDREAHSLLVECYSPLVRGLALTILYKLPNGTELDDLVSDGMFGLLRAIDAFDLNRGYKFETYATQVVRGAIYNGLRRMDWLPERTRMRARTLQKAIDKISSVNGRQPTETELAAELQLSSNEVFNLISDLGCVYLMSLDQPVSVGDDGGSSVVDMMQTDADNPLLEIEFAEQRELLRQSISHLSEREQYLIKKHYFEGETFETIAKGLGVSKQRISQMHAHAVRLMREHIGDEVIEPDAVRHFSIEG